MSENMLRWGLQCTNSLIVLEGKEVVSILSLSKQFIMLWEEELFGKVLNQRGNWFYGASFSNLITCVILIQINSNFNSICRSNSSVIFIFFSFWDPFSFSWFHLHWTWEIFSLCNETWNWKTNSSIKSREITVHLKVKLTMLLVV